jgi:ABC-type polysaccharide/polyol phosphate transport system ATPase subunit
MGADGTVGDVVGRPAVVVRNVSKYYSLADSQWTRLRRIFSAADPGAIAESKNSGRGSAVCALHDVSFSVAEGEALGIIGANGSGKSTLLQIVAGILRPTSGSVELNGRCSTLLELGSGFAPEFTGRQNVHLNAAILGLSREEIEAKFDSIHRFSGIGDFIDQPIRTYSTGMVLRLAFAVAVHSEPRILIVDEALAVGDVAFRQRCMRRIHELRSAGVTILFVSHDTTDVKALCERCLWLERGVVRGYGEADEVVAQYLATTVDGKQLAAIGGGKLSERQAPADAHPQAIAEPAPGTHRYGNGAAAVTGISLPVGNVAELLLRMRIRGKGTVSAPIAGFLVRNAKGENIFGTNSARENHPLPALNPGDERIIDFHLTMPRLAPGIYSVSVAVSDGSIGEFEVCDYIEDAIAFEVKPGERPIGCYMELPCRAVDIHRS